MEKILKEIELFRIREKKVKQGDRRAFDVLELNFDLGEGSEVEEFGDSFSYSIFILNNGKNIRGRYQVLRVVLIKIGNFKCIIDSKIME